MSVGENEKSRLTSRTLNLDSQNTGLPWNGTFRRSLRGGGLDSTE